jgi:hypothetical protein
MLFLKCSFFFFSSDKICKKARRQALILVFKYGRVYLICNEREKRRCRGTSSTLRSQPVCLTSVAGRGIL